jgi:hypothetical protein
VLAISIIEVDNDRGAFAKSVLRFQIDSTEYTGKKILAVPRCCQYKFGTQDRERINSEVMEREQRAARMLAEAIPSTMSHKMPEGFVV